MPLPNNEGLTPHTNDVAAGEAANQLNEALEAQVAQAFDAINNTPPLAATPPQVNLEPHPALQAIETDDTPIGTTNAHFNWGAPPAAFNPFEGEKVKFSYNMYGAEMKKSTRKSKKESTADSGEKVDQYKDGSLPKDLYNLVSIYGHRYNGTIKDNWTFYKNIGWLYCEERYAFRDDYRQCVVDNQFYPTNDCVHACEIVHEDGDPVTRKVFICRTNINDDWFCCYASKKYYRSKYRFTVKCSPTESVDIASGLKESNAALCDLSGDWWIANMMVAIRGSDKYKRVNSYDAKDSGLFAKCPECKRYFEKGHLTSYPTIYNGTPICPDCHTKLKYHGAIGPWNFKDYPAPIYSQQMRLGHSYDENGRVCATMKQTPVVNQRLFGVEAEVELWREGCEKLKLNRFDMAVRVKEVLGVDFVSCKEDGTLTLNGKYNNDTQFDPDGSKQGKVYAGFEIVTCPADMATQRERWSRIAGSPLLHNDKGTLLLRAWDTTTCGFHVHVTREALTTLQIGRMLKFINSQHNARFIHKIAGRGSDVFCRYQDKQFPDVLHPDRVVSAQEQNDYNRRRRVALNLSNDHTVEFRIFRGTIHPNHILRNLCFVEAVCNYCYPASRSFKDMEDYSKFVYYVSSNTKLYPELAAWFVREGQIAKRKIAEGVDIKKLTIHPDFVAEVDEEPKIIKVPKKKKTELEAQLSDMNNFDNF